MLASSRVNTSTSELLHPRKRGSKRVKFVRSRAGQTLAPPRYPWLAETSPTLHNAPEHASCNLLRPSIQLRMHHALTLGSSHLLPHLQRIGYLQGSSASHTVHGVCLLYHSYRNQVSWYLSPTEKQDTESA